MQMKAAFFAFADWYGLAPPSVRAVIFGIWTFGIPAGVAIIFEWTWQAFVLCVVASILFYLLEAASIKRWPFSRNDKP